MFVKKGDAMSPDEMAAQMLGCEIEDLADGLRWMLRKADDFVQRCPLPDDFPGLVGLRSRQTVAAIIVMWQYSISTNA